MSNDPTPWDLAMEAIEDRGCDCDSDPEDIADHTCIAARCEHALLIERAARDEARAERDRLSAAVTEFKKWSQAGPYGCPPYSSSLAGYLRQLDASFAALRDIEDRIRKDRNEAEAERDALRAVAADREHPLHLAVRMADTRYRETGRGAAELDAANLAWLEASCPLEVEITAEDMARVTTERDAAAAKERAAVVAWVRDVAATASHNGDRCAGRIEEVADAIEAGDHLEVSDG